MNIVEINSYITGSTGNIMQNIAKEAESRGYNTLICYPPRRSITVKQQPNHVIIGNVISRTVHRVIGKLTGLGGCFSVFSTRKLIKTISTFHPDIIHLHNLHNCYINIPMLFSYIKKNNIPVIWTLHDCWAFTGRCPHFLISKCENWKTGCSQCTFSKKDYPETMINSSALMWKIKRKCFIGVNKLTLVTPSNWLAKKIDMSFLRVYQKNVINNGIDLRVFKPTDNQLRGQNNWDNSYIILGVSFGWNNKKGLDVFVKLAKLLPSIYQIVLVGTDDIIDKSLPKEICSVHRTENQYTLAQYYSIANVFLNPTREDTFPTTILEALACGIPVIASDVGGIPEIINNDCGILIDPDNIDMINLAIERVCVDKVISKEDCIKRSRDYDMKNKFIEYVDLFERNIARTE